MTDNTESKIELKEVFASDILYKIQKGEPIYYDHVRIIGELDLDTIDLPLDHQERNEYHKAVLNLPDESKVISSSIVITYSKFDAYTNFYNIIFKDKICLERSTFNQNANFIGCLFESDANFGGTQFEERASFQGSRFNRPAYFPYSQFKKNVYFTESLFLSAFFEKSRFEGDVNFNATRFENNADFTESLFENANFVMSRFDGDATFWKCQFKGNANFGDEFLLPTEFARADFGKSEFKMDANFDISHFGHADFSGATFSGFARFRKAEFSKKKEEGRDIDQGWEANFKDSQFSQGANFSDSRFCVSTNFSGSKFIGDAIFDGATFNQNLSLNRTRYEKLYIRWKSIAVPKSQWRFLENRHKVSQLDYNDAAYLMLIENLKNLGFFEDADNCYYNYRLERRRELPTLYKPIDWVLMALYGYGVRPLRPLGWLIFLLVVSIILHSASLFGGVGDSSWAILNTSLTVFLSGTTLIEDPNHPATWMLFWVFTIEKLLASLFFGLFLISAGRTIIR